MKKCLLSIFVVLSLILINSCTPLMNDLEKGDGNSNSGGGYTANNDVDIDKVCISSLVRYEDVVFAKVMDDDGNLVDGKISYQWQYQKPSSTKWIDIEGATQSIYEVGKKVISKSNENNRLRVVVTKNNISLESNSADILKGLIDPDSVKVDMPFATVGELVYYSEYLTCNTVSAKSFSGTDVEIKYVENKDTNSEIVSYTKKINIYIESDYYEEFYSSDYNYGYWLKVKQPTPNESVVENAGFSYDGVNNLCSFESWSEGNVYSYDDGLTWHEKAGSFTPSSRYVLVVAEGENYDPVNDIWKIYESDPFMYTYKTAKFKVVNFELDQADLELTFDEATGTLTMEEGFGEYIWFVKSAWHPEQDIMMINPNPMVGVPYGIDPEHPNKFNLANFFEELPEDMLKDVRENPFDPWPEYGRPGKYYIQGVALASPILESVLGGLPNIPYSATCWVELK